MEKIVWLSSFKIRILPSSPLAMDDTEFALGESATFAASEAEAKAELFHYLEQGKLELVELFHCSSFDDAKWIVQSEDRDAILMLVEEVKYTKRIGFGLFRELEEGKS